MKLNLTCAAMLVSLVPSTLFAEACVLSFNKKTEKTFLSCNGATAAQQTTYANSATSDQNMSYHISQRISSGFQLANCLYYDHGDGDKGRECFFTR
jgi:hypothetical protein